MTEEQKIIVELTPEIKWVDIGSFDNSTYIYFSFNSDDQRPAVVGNPSGGIYLVELVETIPISLEEARKLYKQHITLAAFK